MAWDLVLEMVAMYREGKAFKKLQGDLDLRKEPVVKAIDIRASCEW